MKPTRPVILLLGATAVGKTKLSIGLAKAIGAEIVSVDSRLLYKGMDIGTAKPSLAQRSEVKHHLIDVAHPTERWSLQRYLDATKRAIKEIHVAEKVPLLVGGTGQYFAALVEGWQPPPKTDDPDFRKRLRNLAESAGGEVLHDRLMEIDPETAARVDARNIRRVIRALEIHHITGVIPSMQRKKQPPDYSILKLGLRREREELYERIDKRIDSMIASGWIEEVNGLLQQGVDLNSSALSAIGYRQIAEHLQGEYDLETSIQDIQRLTRQFVRRQDNWFRRLEPEIHWFTPNGDTLVEMTDLVQRWLGKS
jgi:tRNA dimethylallyltransferase